MNAPPPFGVNPPDLRYVFLVPRGRVGIRC